MVEAASFVEVDGGGAGGTNRGGGKGTVMAAGGATIPPSHVDPLESVVDDKELTTWRKSK